MNKTVIQALMRQYITVKSKEIIAAKPKDQQYLELNDMEELSSYIDGVWGTKCGEVPEEIHAIGELACASLDPDKARRINRIRKAISACSTLSGFLAILSSIGLALGWGASIWAVIWTTIAGTSLLGPIALGAAGTLAVVIGGYLMFSDEDKKEASEKALKVYREGIVDIITDSLWNKYKDRWKD